MGKNIEIKARVQDAAGLRERVVASGADHIGVLIQTDTFFPCASGRLKLRQFADGAAELIAYERSNQAALRMSTYVRTPTNDGEGLLEALCASLGVHKVVRKERELFLAGQTRIHLDKVAELGDFMEIEVVLTETQSAAEGEAIGQALLAQLGITTADCLAEAYVDLLPA